MPRSGKSGGEKPSKSPNAPHSPKEARAAKGTGWYPPRVILAPADRSEVSKIALVHAAAFARAFDARLRVLHVAELPPVLPVPEDGSGAVITEGWLPYDVLREQAEAEVARIIASIPELAELSPEAVVRTGVPADEILLEIEEAGCDMAVLATHGRSRLTRFLLGSVAEKVTLSAPCPVLSIRPGTPAASEKTAAKGKPAGRAPVARPRRILVPTDLSETSFGALAPAVAIAERFDGEVSLLAVLEDPLDHPEIDWKERAGITAEEMKSRMAEATRSELRARVEELGLAARVNRLEVGFGRPAATLVERAEAEGVELIVIASRGRGAVSRAILGSVARDVVRHASCPVLTIR